MNNILRKCRDVYRHQGMYSLIKKIYRKLRYGRLNSTAIPSVAETYERLQKEKAGTYDVWRKKLMPSEEELARQRGEHFDKEPLISIVVPVYNTNTTYLKELVDSIFIQTYGNWELCLVDGCSSLESTKRILEACDKQDERVRIIYLKENNGISGNTNEGITAAKGEYIAFSDHDDVWEPDALYEIVKAINEQAAEVIYTDEDKINDDSTLYYEPHLKPIFSPEKLESCNYFCHLMVVSRRLLDQVGFLDSRFDGSQDHELTLRVCEKSKHIVHIPRVLYHWRQFSTSMSKQHLEKCQERGRLAVKEHLERLGRKGEVTQEHGYRIRYHIEKQEKVSVIMVVHQNLQDVLDRFRKLADSSSYRNIELWVVNMTGKKIPESKAPIYVVEAELGTGEYEARNRAVEMSSGVYILFMDEDLLPNHEDWLEELIMYGQLEDIGAVGGKLFYGDNNRIYATNYLLTAKGPLREFNGHSRDVIGNGGRERITRNVSAIPVELLLVKRTDFDRINGFNISYKYELGDVDFCLRLLEVGKRNVFTPFVDMRFVRDKTDDEAVSMETEDGSIYIRNNAEYFKDEYSIIPFDRKGEEDIKA